MHVEQVMPKQYGSMGLKGLWAQIGNSTAMVVITVVLFIAIFQVSRMHTEGMEVLQKLHEQEREFNREVHDSLRRVVEKNTIALNKLAEELSKR